MPCVALVGLIAGSVGQGPSTGPLEIRDILRRFRLDAPDARREARVRHRLHLSAIRLSLPYGLNV